MQQIRVWDLPVRVFHWALVALVGVAWITGETELTTVHEWAGYSILTLVLFRILWGLVGSANARFSHFLRPPREALAYLRGLFADRARHYDTHNPAGGWMVMLLLLALLLQVGTGLFANDEVMFSGPFAPLVGESGSEMLTEIHEATFNLILLLVGVHVAAVLWHELLGERLIRAMVRGLKASERAEAAQRAWWLALPVLAVAAGLVWWLLQQAPPPSGY